MKTITFASFKGGAGKTTALMAACSSLAAQGRRIALFEADPNEPLTRWREDALEQGTWDPLVEIFLADDMPSYVKSFEKAESAGYEFALIDTQGGGSELNNAILVNSSLVIVPTSLSPLDIDAAIDTLEYAVKLFTDEKVEIPTGVLLQRMPIGRLTVSQQADLKVLSSVPQFTTQFPERDAFRSIKARGMLHRLHASIADDPAKRLAARHIATAIKEADDFARDILESVSEAANAV